MSKWIVLKQACPGGASANQMQIRFASPAEDEDFRQLVLSVFDESIIADFNNSGIQAFYEFMSLEKVKERSLNSIRLVVETSSQTFAGVLEGRDMSHITLLFIQKDFQRQGMGKCCWWNSSNLQRNTIHSWKRSLWTQRLAQPLHMRPLAFQLPVLKERYTGFVSFLCH